MTGTDEGRWHNRRWPVSEAETSGVPAHLIIERGEVGKTLDRLVRAHHIDVLMTASRREDVEQRYFLRSVPQRLMATEPHRRSLCGCGISASASRDILVLIIGGLHNAERCTLVSRLATHFLA
jgi:hypothetical protein